MASYVVRIYRAEERPQPRLTGVVMGVEDETRHPFRTIGELWSILAALERFDDVPASFPRRVHAQPLCE